MGSLQNTWDFDTALGRVTSSKATGQWKDYREHDEESLKLAEVISHDGQWTAQLHADAERYFKAVEDYNTNYIPHDWAVRTRVAAEIGVDEQLKRAREMLESGEAASQNAVVRDHFRRMIALHDENAGWWKSSTTDEFSLIVDKPAPEWTADDLAGNAHSLTDYRGKVVVLDFWFRRCNYCIRAQPQVDAVVEKFKDQPVQFLGMNVDEDVEDAKFAVEQLRTIYPTILAKDIKDKYPGAGCPSWFVIDKQGVVRSIFVGYSSDLEEDLLQSISKLLKDKTQ